jgi:AAA+ ATPase superfamily predicted ATPase
MDDEMGISFIGRKHELTLLHDLQKKGSASLVVVYGRRRIGKSRLIEEFGKDKKFYTFSGIFSKKETTAQDQLNDFYQQFLMYFKTKKDAFTDWAQAFHELAQQTKTGKIVILLDEITWMGSRDPNFLGKLKNAWDIEFKKNSNLILVLCGSVSSWVEKNLISDKGFFGRISLKIKLVELTLPECQLFWENQGTSISNYEKLKLLSITGGIPKYLEEVDMSLPSDENINRLCFMPSGLLFNDYDHIFTSMLEHRSELYQRIVEALCNHNLPHRELLAALDTKSGGMIADYIDELEISGFIAKDYTWNIKEKSYSRFCQYRLSDNYIRFYIKYILSNIQKIKAGKFKAISINSLPGWSSIMGIQVENLVIHNRDSLLNAIHVYPADVVFDGPFFQRKTAKIKGCQIDYLIQAKQGVLYLCEIKFSRSTIDKRIITEIREKMNRIFVPNNISIVPVLIHIGEVSDDVIDSQFFGKIVNIGRLFDK